MNAYILKLKIGVKIESTITNSPKHVSHFPEEAPRRRSTTPEKIRYPQTFTQVGADYGFPADISISGIIRNLVGMTWASTGKGDVETDRTQEKNEDNSSNSEDDRESNRLVESAYDIFNAGLKLASDLIGYGNQYFFIPFKHLHNLLNIFYYTVEKLYIFFSFLRLFLYKLE